MKAYVVRLKEGETHARELVGFFVAHSLDQLYRLIDECAPPIDCEYKEMDAGGIYWPRHTGNSVPLPLDFDFEAQADDWSYLPNGAELSDGWEQVFHEQAGDETVEPWCPVTWGPSDDGGEGQSAERSLHKPGAWNRRLRRR